ncbi:hypothetical protein ACFQ4O_13120 [Methylopila musalis]|uniref:Uncharacterized protein n=1 Tax=Methylopila musalis TaxID=1134781 RepID=A0ABW3ZA36_9HYPH
MTRPWAAVALIATLAPCAAQGEEGSAAAQIAACRTTADPAERLACYDGAAARMTPPTFAGRLTVQTDPFTITGPTALRYESDGPIFVLYLKDAEGQVIQNLHIGGGGSAVHLIEKPGSYSLLIAGAETWRVWLEPRP